MLAKQRDLLQQNKSIGVPALICGLAAKEQLLDQNNKSLWVPDVTCRFLHAKQRDFHEITSFYGSQPSSVVFGCKRANFGPEQQVSMGPRYHLSFCTLKTAWLAQELLVSMGPSPHLWFLHAKQRLLDQNDKYLWVPGPTCGFSMQNSDFWNRITTLYESQISPVILGMYNSVLTIRNTSLYGTPPLLYMHKTRGHVWDP